MYACANSNPKDVESCPNFQIRMAYQKSFEAYGSLVANSDDQCKVVAFTDTTELAYGLPERSYNSFFHASEEAAISRLYGGIHYMMAISEGVEQGQKVGDYIVNQIQTIRTPL